VKSAMAVGLATLSVLAVIVITGITSAGAVEPAAHFMLCRAKVGGPYQFGCRLSGPPFEWEKTYVASTPESIKTTGLSAFEFETTVLGKSVLITCTSEAGTGTAKNPEPFKSTNGEGEATLTFEGCTVAKLGACAVAGKKITTSKLHEAAEESKTLGLGIKFTPATGTTFAKIILNEECAIGEEIVVQGSDFGIANVEGELEFTNASSSLTVGGKEAKLRGKLEQENEKGDLVSID
jgi:hypothetical protein